MVLYLIMKKGRGVRLNDIHVVDIAPVPFDVPDPDANLKNCARSPVNNDHPSFPNLWFIP
jgi:hypothetical protein